MSEIKPRLKILILEDNRFDVILIKELILSEKKDTEFYCTNTQKCDRCPTQVKNFNGRFLL